MVSLEGLFLVSHKYWLGRIVLLRVIFVAVPIVYDLRLDFLIDSGIVLTEFKTEVIDLRLGVSHVLIQTILLIKELFLECDDKKVFGTDLDEFESEALNEINFLVIVERSILLAFNIDEVLPGAMRF